MFTENQKNKMSEALEKAKLRLWYNREKQLRITQAHKELMTSTDSAALTLVSDLLCGLHLEAIAETGFDLNGTPYYTKYRGLPAVYVLKPRTTDGHAVAEHIKEKNLGSI